MRIFFLNSKLLYVSTEWPISNALYCEIAIDHHFYRLRSEGNVFTHAFCPSTGVFPNMHLGRGVWTGVCGQGCVWARGVDGG